MIHRLSRGGGSLCASPHVPLTAKYSSSRMEVWCTAELPSGECTECASLYAGHVAALRGKPVPTIGSAELQCPRCNRFHVDREEWYHRPHRTHLCEHCGNEWYVAKGVRGIEPVSLRGRVIALRHALADWLYGRLS